MASLGLGLSRRDRCSPPAASCPSARSCRRARSCRSARRARSCPSARRARSCPSARPARSCRSARPVGAAIGSGEDDDDASGNGAADRAPGSSTARPRSSARVRCWRRSSAAERRSPGAGSKSGRASGAARQNDAMPSLPAPTGHVHRYRASVAWAGTHGRRLRALRPRATGPPPIRPTAELTLSPIPPSGAIPAGSTPSNCSSRRPRRASCCRSWRWRRGPGSTWSTTGTRPRPSCPRTTIPCGSPASPCGRPSPSGCRSGAAAGEDALVARVRRLVDVAHHECYIANTLTAEMAIEPTITVIAGHSRVRSEQAERDGAVVVSEP